VLDAVQRSNRLLAQLCESLDYKVLAADFDAFKSQADGFLRSLIGVVKLPELLISLLIWLQQRPEFLLLQQHETAAASEGTLHSIGGMWTSCLACFFQVLRLLLWCYDQVPNTSEHALQLLQQADKQGEHDLRFDYSGSSVHQALLWCRS
jgi:hypothetical protein